MTSSTPSALWPDILYTAWRESCSALHLWSQIVGKYRLAHTPWINHSWHATLYVASRGLTTGPVPDGARTITLTFDFCDHCLLAEAEDGAQQRFPLEAMSTAQFLGRTGQVVTTLGGHFDIDGRPNEVADAVPFAEDTQVRPYDAEAVRRFHQALTRIERVFAHFRTAFLGKVSPVHLFWGSFDLAVTRFSGRCAPLHPGGFLNLPDAVTREAYSHEVSSAGFWPGGGGIDEAMFYSYAYPVPERFERRRVLPAAARFDEALGEFLLPYAAVRDADDPEADLMQFLQSTYAAAAETGEWNRAMLECDLGVPRVPRAVESPN